MSKENSPTPEELNMLHNEALRLDKKASKMIQRGQAETYQQATGRIVTKETEKDGEQKKDWPIKPEMILTAFKGYKPEDLISRELKDNPQYILPKLKQIFPDKNIEIKEVSKDYWEIDLDKKHSIGVLVREGLQASWSVQFKRSRMRGIGRNITCLYDLVNVIKNPEATVEALVKVGKKIKLGSWIRFSEAVMRDFRMLHEGASGTYGVSDEGSNVRSVALGHLINFGLSDAEKEVLLNWKGEEETRGKEPGLGKRLKEIKPLKGKTILEIGCGRSAEFLGMLHSLGAECIGIDVQKPISDLSVKVYQADITNPESLPEELKGRKFDYVISTMTFLPEVMDRPVAAAFKSLDFLKDSGVAIFSPKVVLYDIPEEEFFDYNNLRPQLQPNMVTVIKRIPAKSVDIFTY